MTTSEFSSAIEAAYADWAHRYVRRSPGGDFVVDPERGGAATSEGMAYGLLFAAATDRPRTFERLWRFAEAHFNRNGLMAWLLRPEGGVSDWGSAADADQDMAYALALGGLRWRSDDYLAASRALLARILLRETDEDGVILPGDSWGPSPPFNPSYVAPGYYPLFATLGDASWTRIRDANDALLLRFAHPVTGLLPDWIRLDGSEAHIPGIPRTGDFSYDAVRVPLRMHAAGDCGIPRLILRRMGSFFQGRGAEKAGYTLDGTPLADFTDMPFLCAATISIYAVADGRLADGAVSDLVRHRPSTYYGTALRLWTLLLLSGALSAQAYLS